MSERAVRKEMKAYADAWKSAVDAGHRLGMYPVDPFPQTTTQRIIALEADVARLQWQVAKLLAKPRKKNGGRK